MIHRIVQFALRQRLLILLMVAIIALAGIISFHHMPVDAYPDLAPTMVEIITQWPGHAAEEVERLVTVPTEVEMNGVPKMSVMRSISLYGLSDVVLTFNEGTDDYFARQLVFQRLSQVTYPTGVTPTLAPLASPFGTRLSLRLESPDRTPQELKIYEDWVIAREYKQVPGVADDSGFGGTVMQYQVLLDPARLYAYHITVPTVVQQLYQQFQCRRRVLFAGRPVLLCSRPRAHSQYLGYRRCCRGHAKWRAGTYPRHRRRNHRERSAPRRIRLQQDTMTPLKASS